MNTKTFSCGIGKPRYYIVFDNLSVFITLISFYSEWTLRSILYSIVIVNSLIVERSWLGYGSTCNQTLNRPHQWINWLLWQLILYQWTWLFISVVYSLILFIWIPTVIWCLLAVDSRWSHRIAFLRCRDCRVVLRDVDFFNLYLI